MMMAWTHIVFKVQLISTSLLPAHFTVIGREPPAEETTCEAVITRFGPDKPQSVTGRRAQDCVRLRRKGKKRCRSEEIYTFAATQHPLLPSFLSPESPNTRLSTACSADGSETPCFNLSSYAATHVSGTFFSCLRRRPARQGSSRQTCGADLIKLSATGSLG